MTRDQYLSLRDILGRVVRKGSVESFRLTCRRYLSGWTSNLEVGWISCWISSERVRFLPQPRLSTYRSNASSIIEGILGNYQYRFASRQRLLHNRQSRKVKMLFQFQSIT